MFDGRERIQAVKQERGEVVKVEVEEEVEVKLKR